MLSFTEQETTNLRSGLSVVKYKRIGRANVPDSIIVDSRITEGEPGSRLMKIEESILRIYRVLFRLLSIKI